MQPFQIPAKSAGKLETGTFAAFVFARVDISQVHILHRKCLVKQKAESFHILTP
jgi:hypothetical protein